MDKFSREKYDRRQNVFAKIRGNGTALKVAKQNLEQISTWSANDVSKSKTHVKVNKRKAIEGMREYLSRYSLGCLDGLAQDRIGVSYAIFGNIRSISLLGLNTQGVEYQFLWETLPITVTTYAGNIEKNAISEHMTKLIATDCKDRSEISKATGWDRNECNTLSADSLGSLASLARVARCGSNKYTRLVKGMLVYLDLLHYGNQRMRKDVQNVISYTPNAVINSYRASNRSYAFCSQPQSTEYMAALFLMGEAYPNPSLISHCHVNVPADGDLHYLVLRTGVDMRSEPINVTMTKNNMLASIVKYAGETGCSSQLESALICACSLYENRYLREVSLPSVNSTIDLIMLGFLPNQTDESTKPHITADMAKVCGRVHQMCTMLIIKDVIIAGKLSTAPTLDYTTVTRQWLSSQDSYMREMDMNATPIRIIEMTSEMKWTYLLNTEDINDVDEMCMLECLWLCDGGKNSMKDGGIMMFKDARKDNYPQNPYLEVFRDELRKGNIVYDPSELPDGDFSVMGRHVTGIIEMGTCSMTYTQQEVTEYEPVIKERVKRVRMQPGKKESNTTTISSKNSEKIFEENSKKIRKENVKGRKSKSLDDLVVIEDVIPTINKGKNKRESISDNVTEVIKSPMDKTVSDWLDDTKAISSIGDYIDNNDGIKRSDIGNELIIGDFAADNVEFDEIVKRLPSPITYDNDIDQPSSSKGNTYSLRKIERAEPDNSEIAKKRAPFKKEWPEVVPEENLGNRRVTSIEPIQPKSSPDVPKGIGKFIVNKREAQLPPAEIMREQKSRAFHFDKSIKEYDGMESRIQNTSELINQIKDNKISNTMEVENEDMITKMIREAGEEPGMKTFNIQMHQLIHMLHERGVVNKNNVKRVCEILGGITIKLDDVINWRRLIDGAVGSRGDMLSSYNEPVSGVNYRFKPEDSRLLNITTKLLRKSYIDSVPPKWVLKPQIAQAMAKEFRMLKAEKDTLDWAINYTPKK